MGSSRHSAPRCAANASRTLSFDMTHLARPTHRDLTTDSTASWFVLAQRDAASEGMNVSGHIPGSRTGFQRVAASAPVRLT